MYLGSGKPLGDGIYWPSNVKDEAVAADQYASYQRNETDNRAAAEQRGLSPNNADNSRGQGGVVGANNPNYTPSQH